jgi:hypothetical protein
LASDFTVCLYIKPADSRLGWIFAADSVIEQWIDVDIDKWVFIAFVRNGSNFIVYKNGFQLHNASISGALSAFLVKDSSPSGSSAVIDEVKVFNVAKTPGDILRLQSENCDVEYFIDGKNFKDFGVYVSASSGLIGLLDRKDGLSVDYDNYHGTVVDKRRPRYKERTITLTCFIEASDKWSFVDSVMLFMGQFDRQGNQRLRVEYEGKTRPLVYEVYCPDSSDIEKKWTYDRGRMVGTFKLKLVECEPVKRVLRHIGAGAGTQASITVTTQKLLNVYWGDGTHTYDVSGNSKTATHTYPEPGEYDIVVTGVIEDIVEFETNCIVIWDRLL